MDDDEVNGWRDLIDFTSIYMDVSCIRGLPKRIRDNLTFKLRHDSEAVNVVWSDLAKSSVGTFQKDDVAVCGQDVCWASNWHRLFEDDPDDARGRMSWVNRFQDALTNASEVLKGMATAAGTLSGGWGFNMWQEYDDVEQEWVSVRYSPAGVVAAIADGSITNKPAFGVSDAEEMVNPNATEDDVFLALAKHVPALSHPVGGTNVTADCISMNINLNLDNEEGGVSRPNRWGRNHKQFGVSWLHSDMKDMAFFYVYKLYEQLIKKGNLK